LRIKKLISEALIKLNIQLTKLEGIKSKLSLAANSTLNNPTVQKALAKVQDLLKMVNNAIQEANGADKALKALDLIV
jgi:hypothetical protein